ncbi:MAG TPA: VWA domain-containing protein, partial [Paracoccaceae bacterium]|nr:VWA domain-containing protein [Paracoccaceae bacterium]
MTRAEDDDDLDRLARALRAAPPPPDPAARQAALALAMENFDRAQGSAPGLRPNSDRAQGAGFLNGVKTMLNRLAARPALAATTSVAALMLGVVIVLPVMQSPGPTGGPVLTEAPPAPAPAAPQTAPTDTAVADTATDGAAAGRPEPEALAMEAPVVEPVIVGEAAPADMMTRSQAAEMKTAPAGAPPPVMAFAPDAMPLPEPDTEAFANADPNPVKVTAEEPVSTFSVDVDTASYAVVRSSLMAGVLPPPEAVRIEEMVNYFPYAYTAPEPGEAPFRASVTVMPAPWNDGRRLVQIGLQGRLPAIADRPPLNLVFLVDTSGSMQDADKLPLLKQSLRLMLPQLRPTDQVAIVAYAGSAGEVLPPTAAEDRATILSALDRLEAGGSTAGAEGLELAYQVAARMAAAGEVSRILLATDGDFNVGVSDPEGLEAYVARQRETGTYLSVLGFGRGNLDDAVMQSLAQNGNGTAAYIDTLSEARKVLVDQLTGALFPIADDVKIQVEWNPATVAEYRLIGYETRALRREDFNNDAVDAGEIGAGTQVTAIYEVTAPGSDALLNDPLRYGTATATEAAEGELGFLRLRWKAPGAETSTLIETPISGSEAASDETRFAAAVAGFGQLLQGSVYLGEWGWDEAIALAGSARGDDPYGYRVEAVNLMR